MQIYFVAFDTNPQKFAFLKEVGVTSSAPERARSSARRLTASIRAKSSPKRPAGEREPAKP